jgi:hypothetical protein
MCYARLGMVERFPSIYSQLAKEDIGLNKTIAMLQHLPILLIFLCPPNSLRLLLFLKNRPIAIGFRNATFFPDVARNSSSGSMC